MLTVATLVRVGVGMIMAIHVNNIPFMMFMAGFEALGCVLQFAHAKMMNVDRGLIKNKG